MRKFLGFRTLTVFIISSSRITAMNLLLRMNLFTSKSCKFRIYPFIKSTLNIIRSTESQTSWCEAVFLSISLKKKDTNNNNSQKYLFLNKTWRILHLYFVKKLLLPAIFLLKTIDIYDQDSWFGPKSSEFKLEIHIMYHKYHSLKQILSLQYRR